MSTKPVNTPVTVYCHLSDILEWLKKQNSKSLPFICRYIKQRAGRAGADYMANVIDVFANEFPEIIKWGNALIYDIDPDHLDRTALEGYVSFSVSGIKEFRIMLIEKLIAKYGDKKLEFTVT